MILTRMKVSLFLLVFVACLPSFVSAQDLMQPGDGMDFTLFKPAVDTKGHFTIDASPVLPHLGFSVGLLLDFGFNSWLAVEQQQDLEIYETTKMDHALHGVFMGNVGFLNRFVVGLQIPIAYAAGTGYDGIHEWDPNYSGWSTKGAFGDIVLHAKASLLRADRDPIGIAAIVAYQIGSGPSEIMLGEPGNAGAVFGKLVFDAEPSIWYRLALNVGARFPFGGKAGNTIHNNYNQDDNGVGAGYELFDYGPMLYAGLGQSFSISPDKLDFVVEAYGNHLATRMGELAYLSLEANGGLKMYVDGNSYLMLGGAGGIPISDTESGYGFQNAVWRLFLGFSFEPTIRDRDHDGIPDDDDQCPDDPEDLDDFEDSDGCPDPDNDKDGIPDVEDDCPLIREDLDGNHDWDGCPEEETTEPVERPSDRDNDGILDKDDECPDDPEDKDGFQDSDGCPDLDNDEDGFPDLQDECPLEKEVLNGVDDSDGCPDEGEALINLTEDKFELLKGVQFKTASDVIVGDVSFDILNAVVTVLTANPNMEVRIEGHTDGNGKRKYNIALSNRRAKAVRKYLIKNGIEGSRLEAKGYGPDQPVESNDTEEGRAANRRVVFTILKQ